LRISSGHVACGFELMKAIVETDFDTIDTDGSGTISIEVQIFISEILI
jgi:hypothetical protein